MPTLEVRIGSDRFHMELARLNDTRRPHEIDTEHFTGRVLVRILNAPGAKEGEEGREYFEGRSRKFCIQIEGKFKKPWKGSEILFGTDFDRWIDFPRAPFNAGMRVAKMIDPCTYYEEHPPSERPFIMSPYCACMNTLCAWPAPSRAHDAVVVLRHAVPGGQNSLSVTTSRGSTPAVEKNSRSQLQSPHSGSSGTTSGSMLTDILQPEKKENVQAQIVASPPGSDVEDEDEGDVVPVESLAKNGSKDVPPPEEKPKRRSWFGAFGSQHKEERVLKKYWRFVGFKQDPRVRAFMEAHHASLDKMQRQPSRSSGRGTPTLGPRMGTKHAQQGSHSQSGSGAQSQANSAPVSQPGSAPSMSPANSLQGHGSPTFAPERSFSPGNMQNHDVGTVATGAVNMPLFHRLGTGLRDQGGRTPPPPRSVSPSLAAHGELMHRGPSPLSKEVEHDVSEEPQASQAAAGHEEEGKPQKKRILSNPLKILKPKAAIHALNLGKNDDEKAAEEEHVPISKTQSASSTQKDLPALPPQAEAEKQQPPAPVAKPQSRIAQGPKEVPLPAALEDKSEKAAAPRRSDADRSQELDLPSLPPLERIKTATRLEMEKFAQIDGLTEGDFKLADRLRQTHLASPPPVGAGQEQHLSESKLDEELGPWRFSDPATDMIEDNAFIFTNESVSVAKRRKYFADAKHREDFVYDPDVVYGAAFFSDMMDFNTFDLHIGPVRINVARFFKDMPVRYTLRAADENITFCTVSFQLV